MSKLKSKLFHFLMRSAISEFLHQHNALKAHCELYGGVIKENTTSYGLVVFHQTLGNLYLVLADLFAEDV